MQLGQVQLSKGYSSRLLINKSRGTVWRFGWGEQRKKVIHNYQWLKQAHSVIPTPRPLVQKKLGLLAITSESYIPGQPLAPSEINNETIASIIKTIAPLYQRFSEKRAGRYVSLIHGDFTHRNILSIACQFYFIDGDRSLVAPPEFDSWLLIADAAVHATGQASHRLFLQHLKDSQPTDTPYRQATAELYRHVPAAAINQSSWPQLWDTFFQRCKEHCITDCLRRKKSIDFLDGLE